MSVFQDLVDQHGFTHQYNSVKRFVATLKARAPERFDVLEFLLGEEAQVDYGLGAPTRTASGKYQRLMLFVMTLKYSGKSFRKVVWKTSQLVWAQLHEEAFRAFPRSLSPPKTLPAHSHSAAQRILSRRNRGGNLLSPFACHAHIESSHSSSGRNNYG